MCSLTVACNRYYKQNEELQEEVSYFDVTTWNRLAEVCKEYLSKGRGVRVVGRLKQDRWQDTEGLYQYMLTLAPNAHLVHNNLGAALARKGEVDRAIAHYTEALRLKPDCADAHKNLGSILAQQGKLDEAEDSYRKALALDPKYAKAHNNLGIVLKQKMQLDKAMLHIREALALDPALPEAHVNLAGMLIMLGDFLEGWREFEWRKKMKNFRNRKFSQPAWDGTEISGRTILIHNEREARGFGDTIQSARYLPLLSQERASRFPPVCHSREYRPRQAGIAHLHAGQVRAGAGGQAGPLLHAGDAGRHQGALGRRLHR